MIEVRIQTTPNHFRVMRKRWRHSSHHLLRILLLIPGGIFAVLIFSFLIFSSLNLGYWYFIPILTFLILYVCFGDLLLSWYYRQKENQTSANPTEALYRFGEDSIHQSDREIVSDFGWERYDMAFIFKDGVLFKERAPRILWVAFDSIVSGSREEFIELVRNKVKKVKVK